LYIYIEQENTRNSQQSGPYHLAMDFAIFSFYFHFTSIFAANFILKFADRRRSGTAARRRAGGGARPLREFSSSAAILFGAP
jgi:hypothetical protein